MRFPLKLETKAIRRAVIAFAVLVGIVVAATGPWRDLVLQAQASATKTFTSESVKRSDEPINPNPNPRVGSGRIVWRGAPLIVIVRYAYDASEPTTEGKIPVEPTYDVDATFAASATTREVQEMVKNLLIDKFALRVHTEPRTMSLFRLVPEAGGHKLKPAANKSTEWHGISVRHGRFAGSGVTLPQIARALAGKLERPVIDATGITGIFDVEVVDRANPPASFRAFVESVPHQLGLKLEPATGKVDVLIIDGFKLL
jgi:uncharacterized protein (TIGR03435 family)